MTQPLIAFTFNVQLETPRQNRSNSSNNRDRNITNIMESLFGNSGTNLSSDTFRIHIHDPSVENQSSQPETNNGINLSTLLLSTTITTNAIDSNELCTICHTAFREGDIQRTINNCSHTFHMHCIDRWLTTTQTCPICRVQIRQHIE